MEENKNLWDKTTAELTVKDQLIVATLAPVLVMGSVVVVGAVVTVAEKIGNKFRKNKTEFHVIQTDEI